MPRPTYAELVQLSEQVKEYDLDPKELERIKTLALIDIAFGLRDVARKTD